MRCCEVWKSRKFFGHTSVVCQAIGDLDQNMFLGLLAIDVVYIEGVLRLPPDLIADAVLADRSYLKPCCG